MKTTAYFDKVVREKRPYIQMDWCVQTIISPIRWERQADGRLRFWGIVTMPGETQPRFLRVVTLEDGETIHNAFLDRGFQREENS